VKGQPLAIIGDVHGEATAFSHALRTYVGRRPLVLVGDYVNRGRGSAEVLAILVDLLKTGDATALMGNHDHAFLQYIATGDLAPFARMGGLATITSYTGAVAGDPHAALLANLPASHLDTLEKLRYCYEDEALLVSHCGVSPNRPDDRSIQDLVLGSHPELFSSKASDLPKVVVSGHYAQRDRNPFVSDRYICVDAGCGTIQGAPLAVLEWPERKFTYFEVS
jgi:serine/threonine protein phosphatase 1